MSADEGLLLWVEEALAPIGRVMWRRMMGGATLYIDGTIFAIVGDDALWFKADAESDAVWDAAGAARISMERKDGSSVTMNYRRAPDDVLDDADAMRHWAALAIDAGRRAPEKRKRTKG